MSLSFFPVAVGVILGTLEPPLRQLVQSKGLQKRLALWFSSPPLPLPSSSPPPTLHYPSLGSDSSFDTAALSQDLSVTVAWHWVLIVEDMEGKQRSCVASDFRELEAFQVPAGELFPECFFLQVAASPHSLHPVGVAECLVGASVSPFALPVPGIPVLPHCLRCPPR